METSDHMFLLTFSDWLSRKWWKCGSSFTGYNTECSGWVFIQTCSDLTGYSVRATQSCSKAPALKANVGSLSALYSVLKENIRGKHQHSTLRRGGVCIMPSSHSHACNDLTCSLTHGHFRDTLLQSTSFMILWISGLIGEAATSLKPHLISFILS